MAHEALAPSAAFAHSAAIPRARPCAARSARRPLPVSRHPARSARVRATLEQEGDADGGRDGEFEGVGKGMGDTDWDQSWQSYRATSAEKGGVFGIAPPRGGGGGNNRNNRNNRNGGGGGGDMEGSDRYRAEQRVADAWTSEAAFLAGAGVIGAVAALYAYVLLSGGLS